ncbi:uncharacterized protein F5147DRAFT_648330 [Suillus discolor]|uniref:Uncharacterized protein n=1 Tax=Suillus discolor TaxID=1912936 RepID=A0A9P7FGE5_9AGAM|nr:uncharacterized protein F5147DRAFT_648330 [Suillus discolor]KAG2117892.1 hypothetical protein F5147DRAFT_648330 [Suillus discolor]
MTPMPAVRTSVGLRCLTSYATGRAYQESVWLMTQEATVQVLCCGITWLQCQTSFFHDNVVVMEINNLLAGWPTYTINFTHEHPGPLKLILCLKNASNFRSTEDDDSADEAGGMGKVNTPPAIKEDPDVTMVCEATSKDAPQCVSVQPVQLHGRFKDAPSIVTLWEKFERDNDYMWPPHCGFRNITTKEPLKHVDTFMTLPAAVEALK